MALITFSSLRAKYPGVQGFRRTASVADSVNFSESKIYDIFLSHSYSDKDDIERIAQNFVSYGLSVYIDWKEDAQLQRNDINPTTAQTLKDRMEQCNNLVFVTTENYPKSKWMPWELGYFDGLKGKVAILPVVHNPTNTYKGQEYLGLYPFIDERPFQEKNQNALWVWKDEKTYCLLGKWVNGSNFKSLEQENI